MAFRDFFATPEEAAKKRDQKASAAAPVAPTDPNPVPKDVSAAKGEATPVGAPVNPDGKSAPAAPKSPVSPIIDALNFERVRVVVFPKDSDDVWKLQEVVTALGITKLSELQDLEVRACYVTQDNKYLPIDKELEQLFLAYFWAHAKGDKQISGDAWTSAIPSGVKTKIGKKAVEDFKADEAKKAAAAAPAAPAAPADAAKPADPATPAAPVAPAPAAPVAPAPAPAAPVAPAPAAVAPAAPVAPVPAAPVAAPAPAVVPTRRAGRFG